VVISRAFAELRDFVECAGHLCAADGVMLAMKGVYTHDEISRLPDGFEVKDAVMLDVPEVDGQRHLIIIKKNK
jgi:16S rRNA (guanine527-N7)-methyltransferase